MTILDKGQRVGGYGILGLLGKGGMGEVYHAEQVSMQRPIALKVLSPRLAAKDPSFCQKFIDEARAAGRLNHPNIVGVHDVGHDTLDDKTIYYFSMELVDGENFRTIVEREGALSLDLVGVAMLGVVDALIYAESCGIVHRDIKPENIMMTRDGLVKLADLGLAMEIGNSEETVERSADGKVRVMGTPRYMSPEQARGQTVDHRSDQYCLGATLFHLLTGEPPFKGKTSKELMRSHVLEAVPAASERNESVPENWSALVQRLMAKDPGERYASALALRKDVERVIAGGKPTPLVRARSRPRRSSGQRGNLVALGVTAVLMGIVLIIGYQLIKDQDIALTPGEEALPDGERLPDGAAEGPDGEPTQQLQDPQLSEAERFLLDLPDNPQVAIATISSVLEGERFANSSAARSLLQQHASELRSAMEQERTRRMAELEPQLRQAAEAITEKRFLDANATIRDIDDNDRTILGNRFQDLVRSYNQARVSAQKQLIGNIQVAEDEAAIDSLIAHAQQNQYLINPEQVQNAARQRRAELAEDEESIAAPASDPSLRLLQDLDELARIRRIMENRRGHPRPDRIAQATRNRVENIANPAIKQACTRAVDTLAIIAETEAELATYLAENKPSLELSIGGEPQQIQVAGVADEKYQIVISGMGETSMDRDRIELPLLQILHKTFPDDRADMRQRRVGLYRWYWGLDGDLTSADVTPSLPPDVLASHCAHNDGALVIDLQSAAGKSWMNHISGPKRLQHTEQGLIWSPDQGGDPKDLREAVLPTLKLDLPIPRDHRVAVTLATPEGNLAMVGMRRAGHAFRLAIRHHYGNDASKVGILQTENGQLAQLGQPVDNKVDSTRPHQAIMDWTPHSLIFSYGPHALTEHQIQLPGSGPATLIVQCLRPTDQEPEIRITKITVEAIE